MRKGHEAHCFLRGVDKVIRKDPIKTDPAIGEVKPVVKLRINASTKRQETKSRHLDRFQHNGRARRLPSCYGRPDRADGSLQMAQNVC